MEDVALIADPTVRYEYRRDMRGRLYESGRRLRFVAGWPTPIARSRAGFTNPGARFVREFPAAPRPPDRVQREILFRILLRWPLLIAEVAEEFAALDIAEPELDKLRREILEIEALHPGLEASALRQHLSSHGFAATVDAIY